jgi:hypothetical protein
MPWGSNGENSYYEILLLR